MEPEHHETLAPSSFNALQHCAHYLSSGEETPQSQRGTRLHMATAEILRKHLAGEKMETVWLKEYDELQACDWLFRNTLVELPEILGIEVRVEIWDNLAGGLITFGKCDCYGRNEGIPVLIDWKSGQGSEGDHHAQISIYALGLMDKLGVSEVTEFKDRTAWSLFNCFTETMKGLSIFNLAPRTQALHGLLDQFTGVKFSEN